MTPFIGVVLSYSLLFSSPQSSRSQGTAPHPRVHREEVPISNGAFSCDIEGSFFHRFQHSLHNLTVPAGAEHLLGDDGFIERVLLDDAPEMAEDADIVVKIILHFGSHGFAPLLGGFFAGVNLVELLA